MLCVFDECFCFAFLVVVVVIVVLVTDVLEGTHECTTARSFVRPNFEREGVDAWRERRGGCCVGGRASSKLTRIQERGEFTQAFFDTAESLVNL